VFEVHDGIATKVQQERRAEPREDGLAGWDRRLQRLDHCVLGESVLVDVVEKASAARGKAKNRAGLYGRLATM